MSRPIITHPDICNGQPVLEGTRITAQTVLQFLAAGDSPADVAAAYPALSEADVRGVLAYASDLLATRISLRPVG